MTDKSLAEELSSAPRECWLALDEEQTRVVGHGKTMEEASREAVEGGIEDPILLWAPAEWVPSVYFGPVCA